MHAVKKAGIWKYDAVVNIGVNNMAFTAINVESTGSVHIAYIEAARAALKYATNSGGNWVCTPIDTSVGTFILLSLDFVSTSKNI
jgi:hypothetical protein